MSVMLEVVIHQIAVGRDGSSERCLVLRPRDQADQRICPIIIGANEASAIAAPSSEVPPSRPMTHDLLLNSITELGGTVQHVYIRGLNKSTFYADISISVGTENIALDARPSDAIALAVRVRVPIYIADEVLEQVDSDLQGRRAAEEPRHATREREYEEAASPVTPEQREKLSAFSEFMESLSLDDEGEEATK
jgi:bifunctional DNase/RNase